MSSIPAQKLPDFWPSDCELWFARIEAQFRRHRVTSHVASYDNVVSALNPTTAASVCDILLAPPPDDKYDTFKWELLRHTTDSESRRVQQLLSSEELDIKQTDLFHSMTQLLGTSPPSKDSKILRELFLQRLPNQLRMILCASPTTSIEALATMADQIMDSSHLVICTVDRCDALIATQPKLQQHLNPIVQACTLLRKYRSLLNRWLP
ncbi:uncharacterized protein LOC142578222 [Dermacentor variabilis]|uniref:uncharacterized protein LOC142578222 n=1 Tax=Dermacentor variabilis TaxID=34621 RepID=UPI003F5B1E71